MKRDALDTLARAPALFANAETLRASGMLAQRFGFAPFTILDARSGEWQERKRAWLALGLRSEIGRGGGLLFGRAIHKYDSYRVKEGLRASSASQGSSIFDPVLCELLYRWFTPEGGQIIDPFAGGSVRGIVAGALSRNYWGCDLSAEQIAANEAQADAIPVHARPVWICGDSMERMAEAPPADFVFSCPPYGSLEIYSDDPRDLSRMEWPAFAAAYKRIILRSLARLREDRFACFVVGDFRDEAGFYRNFVSMTVQAFEECGAGLFNEAILTTQVASAAFRVVGMFATSRKMAKTHQNVLVFCKGDPDRAAQACAEAAR
jgi:hypothetical protein